MFRFGVTTFFVFTVLLTFCEVSAEEKVDVYTTPEYIELSQLYADACEQNNRLRNEVDALKNIKVTAVISEEDRELLQQAVENQQKDIFFCKYTVYALSAITLFLLLCLIVKRKKVTVEALPFAKRNVYV